MSIAPSLGFSPECWQAVVMNAPNLAWLLIQIRDVYMIFQGQSAARHGLQRLFLCDFGAQLLVDRWPVGLR